MVKIELSDFDASMILEILSEFNSQILRGDYLTVSNAIGMVCSKLQEGVNADE